MNTTIDAVVLNQWLANTTLTQTSGAQATGDVQVVGAPATGSPAPTSTTASPSTGTPITGGTSATPAGAPTNPIIQFAPFILIFGVFIVMSMLASRKEKRKAADMMSSIKKQDVVLTSAGIMGTVVEVNNDEVVLKVEDGRIRFAKRAVSQIVRPAGGGGSGSAVVEAKSAAKEEREAVRA